MPYDFIYRFNLAMRQLLHIITASNDCIPAGVCDASLYTLKLYSLIHVGGGVEMTSLLNTGMELKTYRTTSVVGIFRKVNLTALYRRYLAESPTQHPWGHRSPIV